MSKLETKNKAIPVVTAPGITENKDSFFGFFNSENIINKGDFIYLEERHKPNDQFNLEFVNESSGNAYNVHITVELNEDELIKNNFIYRNDNGFFLNNTFKFEVSHYIPRTENNIEKRLVSDEKSEEINTYIVHLEDGNSEVTEKFQNYQKELFFLASGERVNFNLNEYPTLKYYYTEMIKNVSYDFLYYTNKPAKKVDNIPKILPFQVIIQYEDVFARKYKKCFDMTIHPTIISTGSFFKPKNGYNFKEHQEITSTELTFGLKQILTKISGEVIYDDTLKKFRR